MYKFNMKLLFTEEERFWIKTELLNFKITLPLAKLDMVGSRLVSYFFRWYSSQYPVSDFLLWSNVNELSIGAKTKNSDHHHQL